MNATICNVWQLFDTLTYKYIWLCKEIFSYSNMCLWCNRNFNKHSICNDHIKISPWIQLRKYQDEEQTSWSWVEIATFNSTAYVSSFILWKQQNPACSQNIKNNKKKKSKLAISYLLTKLIFDIGQLISYQ